MRQKLLLPVFLLICVGCFAQINEDFENGIPTTWTQYKNYDSADGFTISTLEYHDGNQSLTHDYLVNTTIVPESWIVSEAQTISVGVNEFLSFWYMQKDVDYYGFSGVYISTASGDPLTNPDDFTLLQEFDSTYGISEDEWSQYYANLSSYAGETVYIAFKYSGNNAHILYVDDFELIAEPDCLNPIATFTPISDCEVGQQFVVEVNLTNMGGDDDIIITDNQGSPSQTAAETGVYTFGPYDNGTEVVFTLENSNDSSCSLISDSIVNEYCNEVTVDCSVGPVNSVICYGSYEDIEVTYTSSDPDGVLDIVVDSTTVNPYFGAFTILDSDGTTILYSGLGDNGDLTGVTAQSTGNTLTVTYSSGIYGCGEMDNTALDINVSCATCINPQATYTVIPDCNNGPQFMVEVNLADMGSANEIVISDNQGSALQTVSSTGIYTFGPYANSTSVVMTLTNEEDASCEVSSDPLVQYYCSALTVECDQGPLNSVICYQPNETVEVVYTTDNPSNHLNLTVNSGSINQYGNEFEIIDSDGTTLLYSGIGDAGDLSGISVQSTGSTITIRYETTYYSCQDLDFEPFDVTVQCATCVNPDAGFSTISQCDDGDQFIVEVDLTSLGSANAVVISDNQGTPSQTVSSTGTYTFGPYANGIPVIISVENSEEAACIISSTPLTEEYCETKTVFCDQGPTNSVICYNSNEVIEVIYTANTPDGVLDLIVNSGIIDSYGDPFKIYDSDGTTLLYSGNGDNGDISGVSVQSTGNQLTVQYSAGYSACGDAAHTALDISVSCAACAHPQAEFTAVNDCTDSSGTFTVDVDVTDLGSANTVVITDNQGSASQSLSATGVVTFGPYPYNSPVVFTVANADVEGCETVSDPIVQNLCPITTDGSTYTVEELVTDVLIGTPCAEISNITYSGSEAAGEGFKSIGYFEDGNAIPIQSGLMLSTGDITVAAGPNIAGSNGSYSWPGDEDIEALIQQVEGNATPSNNATIIEFDFVPYIDHISFNYMLASDEYGTFQCNYTDAFGFFLTDENGNTVNLAKVPGTNTPVAVTTIRDEQYNSGCDSQNAEYFKAYYGSPGENGLSDEVDPLNFHGFTVSLTAEADVVPGQTYHIKLAIADRSDASYDSAVFLEAGSFDLGTIDLGTDLTVEGGNAPCQTGEATLNSGITENEFVELSWYKGDTLIEGETGADLNVTESGTYTVVAIYGGSCVLSDEIVVEFAPLPEFEFDQNPEYSLCGSGGVLLNGAPSNVNELVADSLSYQWTFNAQEISGATNVTLEATQVGTYSVEVTSYNGCVGTHEFIVKDASFDVDLGGDQTFCDQEMYNLTATIIDADSTGATYEWQGPNGVIDDFSASISVEESGAYTVYVTIEDCTSETTVYLEFNELPDFDLGDDIMTLTLQGIVLDATPTNTDPTNTIYEWSYEGNPIPENGSTVTPVDYGFGTYTVSVYGDVPSCDATDSITISKADVHCALELSSSQATNKVLRYCEDDGKLPSYKITLTASFSIDIDNPEGVSYAWYKNGTLISGETEGAYTFTYEEEGHYTDTYKVVAESQFCTASASKTVDVKIQPYDHPCKITEGLSPGNHDGVNDLLDLTYLNDRSGIAVFEVYNRYGVKVYSANNYTNSWYGQDDNGNELVTGTYYYIIKFKEKDPVYGKLKRGWIYINR